MMCAQDGADLDQVARAALIDRVDGCRKAVGAVAAIIDSSGRREVAYGRFAAGDERAVDAHTIFELGCIIKVFDALLLADMVERRELSLTDPASDYLPREVRVPERGGPITLQHLATHTSGLPGRRTARAAEASAQTALGLYEFLSACSLTRDVGTLYEYSNIGASLLRQVLALRAGMDYGVLLRRRVLDSLQMKSTGIGATPAVAAWMAMGHNDRLEPVPPHPMEFLSNAHDMSTFLEVCLGLRPSPFDRALARMLSVRHPIGPKMEASLGWNVETHGGDEIICRDGVTWGFRTWIGYRPSVQRGVAVLSNAASAGGIPDIGYHLLDGRYPLLTSEQPLMQPPTQPMTVVVSDDVLEGHVGRYQLTPNVMVEITREGKQLYADKTGVGRIAIFPESPLQYFCKEVDYYELPADTRLIFSVGNGGATIGLTLRQRGQFVWLPRVGGAPSSVWFGHVPSAVDANRLLKYAGRYRFGASIVTVTCEGGALTASFDECLSVQLIPESATEFFVENDVINMQLAFEVDPDGRAVALVGTYDGVPRQGERIE
jgi:serine-type D-Ala-D-Ala carboxypeptidase/endopeptidase